MRAVRLQAYTEIISGKVATVDTWSGQSTKELHITMCTECEETYAT